MVLPAIGAANKNHKFHNNRFVENFIGYVMVTLKIKIQKADNEFAPLIILKATSSSIFCQL
jgi:hypothetical protein